MGYRRTPYMNKPFIDYRKDPNFSVVGLETMQDSPIEHHVLDVCQDFSKENEIKIIYKSEDRLLALLIAKVRIEDPYVTESSLVVGKRQFRNIEESFEYILKLMEDCNYITIALQDVND